MEVSLTTVDAVVPPAVTVKVSVPSVSESLSSVTEIVATPLELTNALALSDPPDTSPALIPERVYGTAVPEGTFLVTSVKIIVSPSLTEEVLDVIE